MAGAKQERQEEHAAAAAAAAAAIASVLGNDDLLLQILLLLGSPVWLVRGALVCRRWLRLASAPAFLRRFRGLHPPRVLGLVVSGFNSPPEWLPFPLPPELAAATARAMATLARCRSGWVEGCLNGRLLEETCSSVARHEFALRSLLHAARDTILPHPPPLYVPGFLFSTMFLLEDDCDSTSCLYLGMMVYSRGKFGACFSILRSGVWSVQQYARIELPSHAETIHILDSHNLLSGSKVYMMTNAGFILVLDLATASLSAIEFPDGVVGCSRISRKFSRAEQSGVYLIDAIGFQLRVWHCDGVERWELVDTISLREACAHLNVERWEPGDVQRAPVSLREVSDNAEFVIFELVASGIVCCMQSSNRAVEVVDWRRVTDNICWFGAHPVTMVWPPIFPVLDKASEQH